MEYLTCFLGQNWKLLERRKIREQRNSRIDKIEKKQTRAKKTDSKKIEDRKISKTEKNQRHEKIKERKNSKRGRNQREENIKKRKIGLHQKKW